MTRWALTRIAPGAALALALGACAPGDYFDKWFGPGPAMKPAELVNFKASASAKILWRGSVGGSERYVFTPFVDGGTVYAAGASGLIERFDAASGKALVRFDAKTTLAGGIGGNRNLLLAGTTKGEVLALDAGGKVLWKTQLTSDVLSAPQADQGVVVVRTGDGRIYGLDAVNGSRKWVYQRTLPPLTVRTFIGIVLERGGVFAGFPGGRLVAISLGNGNVGW
jgi:outer membrane protein assembly factor BamB